VQYYGGSISTASAVTVEEELTILQRANLEVISTFGAIAFGRTPQHLRGRSKRPNLNLNRELFVGVTL
jgi:hypothetical protein